MRDYALSGESVAARGIGALSWYSGLTVHGLLGLTDPVIAHKEQEGLGSGFPGHEKLDIPHVLSKQPTYFVFSREFTTEPQGYPSYGPEADAILKREYEIVAEWVRDEENGEEGYFTFLRRRRKALLPGS